MKFFITILISICALLFAAFNYFESKSNNQKLVNSQIEEIFHETVMLLGMKYDGPNSLVLISKYSKSIDEDLDVLKITKNINKIEVLGGREEYIFILKSSLMLQVKSLSALEEYIDDFKVFFPNLDDDYIKAISLSSNLNEIDLALVYMKAVVDVDPQNIEKRFFYALLLHIANRNDESLVQFEAAIKGDASNIEISNMYAHVLVEHRKHDEGEAFLRSIIDKGLADSRTYNLMGYSYAIKRDFWLAKRFFEMAIDKDHTNPIPHRNLALILRSLGDFKNAKLEADLAEKYGMAIPDWADYRSVMD